MYIVGHDLENHCHVVVLVFWLVPARGCGFPPLSEWFPFPGFLHAAHVGLASITWEHECGHQVVLRVSIPSVLRAWANSGFLVGLLTKVGSICDGMHDTWSEGNHSTIVRTEQEVMFSFAWVYE